MPVEPVGDGTQGVVVEGGHLARIDRPVGEHRVPAFPGGGGAHGDRVEPRGALSLEEKAVRKVWPTCLDEGITDDRRSHEPGGDDAVSILDELSQSPAQRRDPVGAQVEHEDQRVGSLGVRGGEPVVLEVALDEGAADLRRQCRVARRVVCVPQDARRLRQEMTGSGEVGRRDEVGVGPRRERVLRGCGGVEPVPRLPVRLPDVAGSSAFVHQVDPGPCALVLATQQLHVAVPLEQQVRQHDRHVAPHRPRLVRVPVVVARDEGHVPRHRSIVALLRRDAPEPVREHSRGAVDPSARGHEEVQVTCPAEALVPLRAVGRDIDEVGPHAPHDVVVQPLEVLV